ncbi:hypothetical protein N7495_003627 [Penicillium taxi]|uniref:uncharacterized protein n=1 Tax=Penicillium taxi TaxID=168475 RepID=UPI0025459F06|nr:uncharacterized protein N7495_003627 [Penicillium taxi]KAJ5898883.1 hypothetical protein N7495_003627 [Penicillium taxi]
MAKPPRTLQTRLTYLLKHWPADAVRPPSVSVQSYLQAALGQKPETDPKKKSETPTHTPRISESSANSLQYLLEDRFARRYPLTSKIRHPASDPDHYDNVVREFAEAPNRDWMGRIWKRIGGILRLQ